MMHVLSFPVRQLRLILDRLDVEDDLQVRADLIDEAIGLADKDPDARAEWEAYR